MRNKKIFKIWSLNFIHLIFNQKVKSNKIVNLSYLYFHVYGYLKIKKIKKFKYNF